MNFNVGDIFWIFLVFVVIQIALKKRQTSRTRRLLIQSIEHSRGSRIILLIHRQETLGILGVPVFRYIDINDAELIIQAIRDTPIDQPIDLVLHTPGGLALPSVQIARAIARRKAPVRALIPHYAMSGGTLIALAADEIIMSEHAILGPVDPEFDGYAAASILRAVEQKSVQFVGDDTLILADQAKMAIKQVADFIYELVSERMSEHDAKALAHALAEGLWTHDFGFTPEIATQLGLPVSTDIPDEIIQLLALYSQPLRQRPTLLH